LAGNIYTKQQLDIENKTFSFANLNKQNTFFFIKIDGMNEIISRDEKNIPIVFTAPPAKSGAKPVALPFYHIKIKELKKVSKTGYTMYCNIYKSSGQQLLFLYESGFSIDLTLEEMDVEVIPGKIYNNLSPFPDLVNTDLKDINGKIELKLITEFDKFLYKRPIADVEKYFGIDENQKPKWIINKTDIKTGMSSFYFVNIGSKGVESKLVLESSKYNNPQIFKISGQKIIEFKINSESNSFDVSIKNW